MSWQTALFMSLLCLAFAAASLAENLLPEKIASMYTGWVAPDDPERDLKADLVQTMLDPLAEAHFTAFYAKFQGASDLAIDLSDPEQKTRVKLVADACAERGLALVAYTYHHPHHGRNPERFPEHAEMPALVLASGETVEDRFALANDDVWAYVAGEALQLAEASLEMPIAAVGIDIEHFMGFPASYDDAAWADFAAERGFDAALPAAERGPFVAQQGLSDAYVEWYFQRWDGVVQRWCEAIHAINPDISIAIMPAHHTHRMTRPFCVHAGTERAPAIIDDWGMYNGSGLTDALLAQQDEVKALNQHNRFVLWFRPDSYRPEDIRVHAYHTLLKTDGYCNWHIGMVLPGEDADAAEREAAAARWAAYSEANETALADLAAGREPTIPFVPVEPMVAQMDIEALRAQAIPQLTPVGDGSGDDRWIPTRELQRFFIHAEAGGQISVGLWHLAGAARPLALQYLLLRPNGEVLRNEAVSPGATEEFTVDAPETGTYALWITGGAGGQAWYAVNVHNPHFAFPALDEDGMGGQLFLVERLFPLTFHVSRSAAGAARAVVATSGNQSIVAQAGDDDPVAIDAGERAFDLPEADILRLTLSDPGEELPDGFYVQYVGLRVEGGAVPYLAISPERRLLP